ncbi:hypothetical protein K438DRAFT_1876524, partial [Mycena galopus ATCC 62051]
PPDKDLKEILFDYQRRDLSLQHHIRYLQRDHRIYIALTKLKELNKKFCVPSARKFAAVEESTAAIAHIISRDVHQGQGPDTVKQIASLHLNLTIPRDFVRATMTGLVGPFPSERRKPGWGKGPKQRSALNAIDTYGMRDHVGKVLWLTVLPNSRLSDAVRHVFLDMVSAFGITLVQVTFDGGSELDWLAAIQTTLRETFAPDLSAEEWKPVVAVQSSSNILIESTRSYDRKFNGRTIRDVLEEGRIYLIPGDVIHRNLFHWLWPKIVQIGLNEFLDYFT